MAEPLMNEDSVVALMRSSTCEADWNINCAAVKHDNGGKLPGFWYRAIIQEGVMLVETTIRVQEIGGRHRPIAMPFGR